MTIAKIVQCDECNAPSFSELVEMVDISWIIMVYLSVFNVHIYICLDLDTYKYIKIIIYFIPPILNILNQVSGSILCYREGMNITGGHHLTS